MSDRMFLVYDRWGEFIQHTDVHIKAPVLAEHRFLIEIRNMVYHYDNKELYSDTIKS